MDTQGAIFVLAQRDYLLYANIGLSLRSTKPFSAVLDIGVGSSLIRRSYLPYGPERFIKPLKGHINMRSENNRPITMKLMITLVTQLVSHSNMLTLKVADRLTTAVIVYFDFCDNHVR